jgi:hypothetical protein
VVACSRSVWTTTCIARSFWQRWSELDICVSVREEGPSQYLAR